MNLTHYLKFWWDKLHWIDLLKTTPVIALCLLTRDPVVIGLGLYTLAYIWTLQVSSLVYGHGMNALLEHVHELYQRYPEILSGEHTSSGSDDTTDA